MKEFPQIPASKASLAQRKLVHGVGINDSAYNTETKINGKRVTCPFYKSWSRMLERCYCKKFQAKRPTYRDCTVDEKWLTFSVFREWMVKQPWFGNQLDKDLIKPFNKHYCAEFCAFVPSQVNALLVDHAKARGNYPIGVSFDKGSGKFKAQIKIYGEKVHLGLFNSEQEASKVYQVAKHSHILEIADTQNDRRVSNGLRLHAELILKGLKQ